MATFDKAVRYEVTAVTETPLRTGPSDGSIDRVLRHRDGQAFLQAASLAGALRGWLEKQDKNAANVLFGSQEKSGQLIVSDMEIKEKAAKSSEDTTIQLRPRLRINGKMGSAADGGKFDVAHMARGTVMQFTLTWLGAESDTDGPAQIEQMLGALHTGEIRLGAQKSNGFGRVALTVRSQTYHMIDKADREAWLQDEFDGQTLELPEVCTESVCTFTVNGIADSILIKDAVPQTKKDGTQFTGNIKENGTAVLPGSSVKGAVRARVQAIANLLHCSESVDQLFGRGAAQGDNGIAGRARFTDVVLDKAEKQMISRIRINKFTGGVIRRGLFTEEPLKSGVTLSITAPQDDICGCALLVYALRDLGLGLYNLGSGGAVGRGYIKVSRIAIACGDKTADMTFGADGCKLNDTDNLVSAWLHTLEERT
ncbi:RAMP superfamily CRISPR-associated protein [uncultured Agathobaculum sp.]|uniref:RAMP superfamily CRISPR-associated protein n=1 Tax=uncultured Agathobaculum sp. TaxID=2048140 RepID=UPI00296E9D5C